MNAAATSRPTTARRPAQTSRPAPKVNNVVGGVARTLKARDKALNGNGQVNNVIKRVGNNLKLRDQVLGSSGALEQGWRGVASSRVPELTRRVENNAKVDVTDVQRGVSATQAELGQALGAGGVSIADLIKGVGQNLQTRDRAERGDALGIQDLVGQARREQLLTGLQANYG